MKKISVITINYNNAAGLKKTVESVIGQVDADFEYVVIDGGSTDGSRVVIEQHQAGIRHWVSEKDGGIYNAMNKGIAAATGEYLLFLNSGDFLCNSKVLRNVMAQGLDKDIVYGNMRINWGNNRVTHGQMPNIITASHMYTDTLWHPVSFIKKSLLDSYGGYNEDYRLVADYDFFFKAIIANRVSTKHIPVEVAEYNTEGISSDPAYKPLEITEREKVIRSYLSEGQIEELKRTTAAQPGFFTRLLRTLKKRVWA